MDRILIPNLTFLVFLLLLNIGLILGGFIQRTAARTMVQLPSILLIVYLLADISLTIVQHTLRGKFRWLNAFKFGTLQVLTAASVTRTLQATYPELRWVKWIALSSSCVLIILTITFGVLEGHYIPYIYVSIFCVLDLALLACIIAVRRLRKSLEEPSKETERGLRILEYGNILLAISYLSGIILSVCFVKHKISEDDLLWAFLACLASQAIFTIAFVRQSLKKFLIKPRKNSTLELSILATGQSPTTVEEGRRSSSLGESIFREYGLSLNAL